MRSDGDGLEKALREVESTFLEIVQSDGIAVATSSGRTALLLALRALRTKYPQRTEVVIPSYSCRGVLDPIVECGLAPIFVDIGDDLNLMVATVAPALSPQTLAVIVPHLGGKYTLDTELIAEQARTVGAMLIEDMCQAMGGQSDGRPWAATAPMAIYSFGLGKNLMATAGGMLVANTCREEVRNETARLKVEESDVACQRFFYMLEKLYQENIKSILPWPRIPGATFDSAYSFNRMNALDVQLLTSQLKKMNEIVCLRQQHAQELMEALRPLAVTIPGQSGPHVWTKFTVLADSAEAALRMRTLMQQQGVETETMYTPLHLRDCGKPYASTTYPVTEAVYERAFNLPVRPSLTSQQLRQIIDAMQQACCSK